VHLDRFDRLHRDLLGGHIDEEWLAHVESLDSIFADADYRLYHPAGVRVPGAGGAVLTALP
jgi:predicted glycosyl hydrolase (DUF1957 family)